MLTENATTLRRRWLSVLARASSKELGQAWDTLESRPEYRWLRPAESGLFMLCGRAGGTGVKFNIGEASLTRCVVETDEGQVGVSYLLGRDPRRAELAALFDALLQNPERYEKLARTVIDPLATAQDQSRELASRKAAATKVEFYTVVRGENA